MPNGAYADNRIAMPFEFEYRNAEGHWIMA